MIIPPEEIRNYITVDENGNWIHADSMPDELLPLFEDFLKKSEAADQYVKEEFGLKLN